MLLDKPLRLCHGAGNGVDTACLMTATNMLIGCGNKGDEAVCVCPVLRAFIITTNDCMPDALRQELYGPLPWLLIGTKTYDIGVMVRRAEILSDAAQELAEYAEYAESLIVSQLTALNSNASLCFCSGCILAAARRAIGTILRTVISAMRRAKSLSSITPALPS